jgi:hypothetical protein
MSAKPLTSDHDDYEDVEETVFRFKFIIIILLKSFQMNELYDFFSKDQNLIISDLINFS